MPVPTPSKRAPARVTPLPWDSAEFGFGVGELTLHGDWTDDDRQALLDARRSGVELVYLKTSEVSAQSLRGLRDAVTGVSLYSDERAVFERSLDSALPPTPPSANVRLRSYPVEAPSAELVSLAVGAGEHSRFSKDPRFPEAAFLRLYREWIRRSTLREVCFEVLVAEPEPATSTELLGFVTVAQAENVANVGLIAVAAHARNRGVASALMSGVERVARDKNCTTVRVVTQQSNEAACRLYLSAGYNLVARSFVHHLWLT